MLRYLDVNGKNKWTVARQVYGYCGYILLHKKSDSIYNECIYSTRSTWPSSVTLVDIPREAPSKFVIGGGRTAGRIDGLLWGISCRWLAKRVNATTLFEVRCRNTGPPWACRGRWLQVTLAIMCCRCSAHVARYWALRGGSRFFVTESAAVKMHAVTSNSQTYCINQLNWQTQTGLVQSFWLLTKGQTTYGYG